MATTIPGGSGCCPCDQQNGCDCSSAACSLECRSKGAIAELCGFPEHVDPSVPPKKYRKVTVSGGYVFNAFADPICTVPTHDTICNWSGECAYDKDSCALTQGGVVNCGGENAPACFMPVDDPGRTRILTPTNESFVGSGDCFLQSSFGKYGSLSMESQLTDEDMEEDAEERAMAPLEWSGAVPCSAATAFRTLRGAGMFTFLFRHAQFRVTVGTESTPAIVGHTYEVTVRLTRRLLTSTGPFLPFAVAIVTIPASAPITTWPEWFDVPNEAGWETKVSHCSVIDLMPI